MSTSFATPISEIGTCTLTDGNYVVAWGAAFAGSVFFRVYDSNGILAQDTETISGIMAVLPLRVEALSNGGFVVVSKASDGSGVAAVIYDSSYNLVTTVTVTTNGGFYSVSNLSNNTFVVTYKDVAVDSDGWFVIYNYNGTVAVVATEFYNADIASAYTYTALLSNGNFVVVYRNSSTAVVFQIYTNTGVQVVSETVVYDPTGNPNGLGVVGLTNGKFSVVFWENAQVRAAVYTNAGVVLVAVTAISGGNSTYYQSITRTASDNIAIVYHVGTALTLGIFKSSDLSAVSTETVDSGITLNSTITTGNYVYFFIAWETGDIGYFNREFVMVSPVDRLTYKRLVAVAYNKFWYEQL
jgi:hypothetical protein